MDSRNFVIVDTRNNRNGVINNVTANTVGELKTLLRQNGYDPTGMELHEGLTNSVLGNDNTPLPRDIAYRGGVTSNLVKSGVMTRKEAYEKVKEYELQSHIYDIYGKNYTQVRTEDLEREIMNLESKEEQEETKYAQPNEKEVNVTLEGIAKAFNNLLDVLDDEGIDVSSINKLPTTTEKIGDYTMDEIEDMFSNM